MSVRLVALDAGDEFPVGRLDQIVDWLEGALADVASPIDIKRVDVVVSPTARPIPGWDVNGYALGPHRVMLGIDPKCTGREKRPLYEQLRAMLAHELHHAARNQGPGYGDTLGEALVSEGLAQCYEEEVGCPTPNYAIAVIGDSLTAFSKAAFKELSSKFYDHPKWFYGVWNDPKFPWSGGYSLGYALIKEWLKEQRIMASQAVRVESSAILPRAVDLFARGV